MAYRTSSAEEHGETRHASEKEQAYIDMDKPQLVGLLVKMKKMLFRHKKKRSALTQRLDEQNQILKDMKTELNKKNAEIQKLELQLVDYQRCKTSEGKLFKEIAKRHITLVHLWQRLETVEELNQKHRERNQKPTKFMF